MVLLSGTGQKKPARQGTQDVEFARDQEPSVHGKGLVSADAHMLPAGH